MKAIVATVALASPSLGKGDDGVRAGCCSTLAAVHNSLFVVGSAPRSRPGVSSGACPVRGTPNEKPANAPGKAPRGTRRGTLQPRRLCQLTPAPAALRRAGSRWSKLAAAGVRRLGHRVMRRQRGTESVCARRTRASSEDRRRERERDYRGHQRTCRQGVMRKACMWMDGVTTHVTD